MNNNNNMNIENELNGVLKEIIEDLVKNYLKEILGTYIKQNFNRILIEILKENSCNNKDFIFDAKEINNEVLKNENWLKNFNLLDDVVKNAKNNNIILNNQAENNTFNVSVKDVDFSDYTLYNNLKNILSDNKIEQKTMADALDVSRNTLASIINNKGVSLINAFKISNLLELSIYDIFKYEQKSDNMTNK